MNKFLLRLPQLGLLALLCGIMLGCKPEADNAFSVKVAGVGPEYVEINVTAPNPVQIAYIVDTKEQLMNSPRQIFKKGTEVTVKGGDVLRLSVGINENTQYYLYACARDLATNTFTKLFILPFKTTQYSL